MRSFPPANHTNGQTPADPKHTNRTPREVQCVAGSPTGVKPRFAWGGKRWGLGFGFWGLSWVGGWWWVRGWCGEFRLFWFLGVLSHLGGMSVRGVGGGVAAFLLSRAGELRMEPGTLAARSKAFAASVPVRGVVGLLVARSGSGIVSVVTVPWSDRLRVGVEHLAAATAARVSEFDLGGLDLGVPVVGRVVFGGGRGVVRDTQVGADMAALAQVLGRALVPGSWVLARVRVPLRGEVRGWGVWLRRRLQVAVPHHHSNESNAVVLSVSAGGGSRGEVESVLAQVVAAMPGFDLPTVVRVGVRFVQWVRVVLVVLVGLGVGGLWVVGGVPWWVLWGGVLAGLVCVGVLGWGLVCEPWWRGLSHAGVVALSVSRPGVRLWPARRPGSRRRGDGVVQEFDGDYPLRSDCFMVGSHLPVALVAPHTGGLTGAGDTTDRDVPPVVSSRVGPLVGVGRGGVPVFLSARDAFAGLVAFGRAGSGKSVLIRQLFAWHLLERLAPSGVVGAPGRECAVVALESKTDGAVQYLEWSEQLGSQALLVDVMDASTFAIELVPEEGSLDARARQLVAQMQYAFGEDAISNKSFDTLVDVAMGAMVVDTEIANVAGVEPGLGVVPYMAVLLECEGQARQEALAGAILATAAAREARGVVSEDLLLAGVRLRALFDGKSPAQRRAWTDAPSSKIKPLLSLGSWWSPSRRRVSWRTVLDRHGVLVVNFGASVSGGVKVDRVLAGQLQAMVMYSLQQAVESLCYGWGDRGRSVAVFADELALLAGESPEVVAWLRDQGRSYGVRPFLASQYPEQLDARVRVSVLGFSTLVALTQDNPDVAASLVSDFAADGSRWGVEDVVNLPLHSAIVRANVGQKRQPAFTVELTSWEGEKGLFAAAQGYDVAGGGGVGV